MSNAGDKMTNEEKVKAFDIISKYFKIYFNLEEKDENGNIISGCVNIVEHNDYIAGAWDVTAYAFIPAIDYIEIKEVLQNVMQS